MRFSLRRQPPHAIDLDPLHQRLLLALARREPLPFRALHAEVEAQRPETPRDVLAALALLEQFALIARLPASTPGAGNGYRRTRLGRRLGRAVPAAPRSPTTFFT